jgi:hypothetical protein
VSFFEKLRGWLAGAKGPSVNQNSSCCPFQIKEISSQAEGDGFNKVWLASASRNDKAAKFRIELSLKRPPAGSPFAFSKGVLMREPDSDGTWLLKEIGKVLGANSIPTKADTVDRLEIDTAILGTSLSRGEGADQFAGSFTSDPPGDWLAVKVFVAEGGGEFYVNLNPALGQGEVALKDECYGDIVVEELARILLPKN